MKFAMLVKRIKQDTPNEQAQAEPQEHASKQMMGRGGKGK